MLDIISVEEKPLDYLHSFVIKYYDKKNNEKIWELASRGDINRFKAEIEEHKEFTDGTMIFATSQDRKKVCLIKEYRVSAGGYVYGIPAGLSIENESIEVTAKREFKEETGLDFEYKTHSRTRYTSIGLTNEKINIAYGYYSGEICYDFQEDEEEIEVILADKQEVIRILENEEVGVRSALLLEQFFKLNEFFE